MQTLIDPFTTGPALSKPARLSRPPFDTLRANGLIPYLRSYWPDSRPASRRRIDIHNTLFAILTATAFLTPLARGQDDDPPIDFSVIRTGELVQTEARVDLPVTQEIAWDVLTDYERYPRFIASMHRSKIVSRSPEGLVVEQQGRFGFLFISQDVNVHLNPPRRLSRCTRSTAIFE